MNHKIAAWCAVLVGLISAAAFADTVRGPLKADTTLMPGTDATTIVLALEDLVSVRLADNGRFDNGVEVDVTIPPAARQYRNLLGLFIYKRVTPPPSQSVSAYSGTRATFVVLPAAAKAFIAIPVKAGVLAASPDTMTADAVIPAQDFPILLTILPVAKGLPASVTDSTFPVAISPIIADRGLLQLRCPTAFRLTIKPSTRWPEAMSLPLESIIFTCHRIATKTCSRHSELTKVRQRG
jgi:hypothetical protein